MQNNVHIWIIYVALFYYRLYLNIYELHTKISVQQINIIFDRIFYVRIYCAQDDSWHIRAHVCAVGATHFHSQLCGGGGAAHSISVSILFVFKTTQLTWINWETCARGERSKKKEARGRVELHQKIARPSSRYTYVFYFIATLRQFISGGCACDFHRAPSSRLAEAARAHAIKLGWRKLHNATTCK